MFQSVQFCTGAEEKIFSFMQKVRNSMHRRFSQLIIIFFLIFTENIQKGKFGNYFVLFMFIFIVDAEKLPRLKFMGPHWLKKFVKFHFCVNE